MIECSVDSVHVDGMYQTNVAVNENLIRTMSKDKDKDGYNKNIYPCILFKFSNDHFVVWYYKEEDEHQRDYDYNRILSR